MMDTMLPFSGGCDSTLCLYDYLRTNPGKKLLVYHVNLKNWEGRHDLEYNAVHKILRWIRENVSDNFVYQELGFDYGTVGRILWDAELWGFFDGILLRDKKQYSSIENIICPYIKTDHRQSMLTGRHLTRTRITATLTQGKKINYLMPLLDLEKAEIIERLPRELFEMVWYCRRPIKNEPCHKCFTCIAIDAVMKKSLGGDLKGVLAGTGLPATHCPL